MTLTAALLDEIERVVAMRERWLHLERTAFPDPALSLPIALMSANIELAKSAIAGDDGVAALVAFAALKSYDDD